jgi:hypothetical protein
VLNLEGTVSFGNIGTGINVQDGVARLFSTTVSNGIGLNVAGGTVASYGMNRICGNAAGNGPPTTTVAVAVECRFMTASDRRRLDATDIEPSSAVAT